MSQAQPLRRLAPRLAVTPVVAAILALALLATGIALALYNERASAAERVRQAQVQGQILAGSLAAPLAFDDDAATREYVNALRANRDVQAVAAYDQAGRLAAGYVRSGGPLPTANNVQAPHTDNGYLVVTNTVSEGGARLGSIYLRIATESLARRVSRYSGIGLLVLMASLMVGVLGAAYASVSEAHRRLQDETAGREKAEEALRQSQKMEAMGQLTGGVAHDFNNLLMVASSGLDLLDRTSDPSRRERLKQGIRQAIDRGASLTQQLLAFARRSPVHPEVVDLRVRLRGMGDLLDRSLRENIIAELRPDPDVWPVEVDPSQLEVAVLNIALNARDAMPAGGLITIGARNQPADALQPVDVVRLSITDTGAGMSREVLARVFEPFFTTKGVGQGTGLGLSQVYGFARSSGGDVQIESEPGRGTTVSLLIPRSMKTLPEAAPDAASAPARASPSSVTCRVLLVEDDDHVADLVAQMLGELSYDTVRASNAAAALDILAGGQAFDVVFSDMVMPGEMSGLELAREITARRPALPIVLTTGYSAAAAAAASQGFRLLVKPYRIDALAQALQTALSSAKAAPGIHP